MQLRSRDEADAVAGLACGNLDAVVQARPGPHSARQLLNRALPEHREPHDLRQRARRRAARTAGVGATARAVRKGGVR